MPDPQVINTLVLPELNGDTDSIFNFLYIRFAFPFARFSGWTARFLTIALFPPLLFPQ